MAAHWTYKDELRGDGEQHNSMPWIVSHAGSCMPKEIVLLSVPMSGPRCSADELHG